MNQKIITRFAPSPTGYLHVGGARTALFNFLFARKNQGFFLLRIEDTDLQRSSSDMTEKILSDLNWMGLEWDGKIVHQAQNVERHRKMAHQIWERGLAYPCFCNEADLKIHRKNYKYDRHCLRLTPTEVRERIDKNIPYSLRVKIPSGHTRWIDFIHGEITIQNEEIEDFIILRSDKTPTYNLAVVVDDHDMNINHVIRGDDHISNTPKQIILYESLAWDLPKFAHIPLILGPDKKRLSKRHGATSVHEYQNLGILPEAFFNFLARLGWTPADDREIMSFDEVLAEFSLQSLSRKSAIFDETKLAWLNQQYLIQKDTNLIIKEVLNIWKKQPWGESVNQLYSKSELATIIELLKKRATYLTDFIDLAEYFFEDPHSFNSEAFHKHMSTEQSWFLLEQATESINKLKSFSEENLEIDIRKLAESHRVSAGKIIHPLRLAITGRSASPGIFEVMDILGRDRVINRLEYFLDQRESLQSTPTN
ncbi:MAG: glutamate--tRNA ligase [bacterium]|nr:MAG: glutamate--tRNA ligase [bacterium]